ncbi:hypothetical protein Scep_012098 [Stephania cephalantha]|uniref:Uncharacterized protein n=1 Tax=Stephania cephalantha TaxID=152367 RepID=A0AAP0JGI2_9MAGN
MKKLQLVPIEVTDEDSIGRVTYHEATVFWPYDDDCYVIGNEIVGANPFITKKNSTGSESLSLNRRNNQRSENEVLIRRVTHHEANVTIPCSTMPRPFDDCCVVGDEIVSALESPCSGDGVEEETLKEITICEERLPWPFDDCYVKDDEIVVALENPCSGNYLEEKTLKDSGKRVNKHRIEPFEKFVHVAFNLCGKRDGHS